MLRRTSTKIILAVAVLLVGGFIAIYIRFFTPDSPPPVALTDDPTPVTTAAPSGQAQPTTPGAAPSPGTGIAGTWRTVPQAAVMPEPPLTGRTFTGYRVREKLARLPASSDGVGRTAAVTGQVRIDVSGDAVTAAEAAFTADVSKLASDERNRDNQIRMRGLETIRFPEAKFANAEPIRFPTQPPAGQVVRVQAAGDLTIHGVTKRVTIPIDAKLSGSQLVLVGSLRFPMSDFNIEPPNVAGVVTTESDATLEFELYLEKS